jgi:hypothetical protein
MTIPPFVSSRFNSFCAANFGRAACNTLPLRAILACAAGLKPQEAG